MLSLEGYHIYNYYDNGDLFNAKNASAFKDI